MENNRANEVIINILQQALAGQLKPESDVNPQNIANAIATKVSFEKTYNGNRYDTIVGSLIDCIVKHKKEAEAYLNELKTDGQLTENKEEVPSFMENFIRGKITAYDEILSVLQKSY